MDDLDTRLIAVLRQDARLPTSKIAAELGVSRATVAARMDRLLENGDIAGFTVALKVDDHASVVRAITMIEVEGRSTEHVIRALSGMREVEAIHTTNGRWDLILELGADALSDFDEVLRRIRLVDGISRSETNLLLATRKTVRPPGTRTPHLRRG